MAKARLIRLSDLRFGWRGFATADSQGMPTHLVRFVTVASGWSPPPAQDDSAGFLGAGLTRSSKSLRESFVSTFAQTCNKGGPLARGPSRSSAPPSQSTASHPPSVLRGTDDSEGPGSGRSLQYYTDTPHSWSERQSCTPSRTRSPPAAGPRRRARGHRWTRGIS